MTFRGFILRLVTVLLITWILGSIIESFGWGLYYALLPVVFYELVRPRWGFEVDFLEQVVVADPAAADGGSEDGLNGTTIASPNIILPYAGATGTAGGRHHPLQQDEHQTMARAPHYSPAIDRFLVSVLYHEARRRGVPMTQLTNELLKSALEGSEAWRTAQTDPTSLAKRQRG